MQGSIVVGKRGIDIPWKKAHGIELDWPIKAQKAHKTDQARGSRGDETIAVDKAGYYARQTGDKSRVLSTGALVFW